MKIVRPLFPLAAIILSLSTSYAQNPCSNKRVFGGEEDPCFDKASPPPPLVVAAILNRDEAKETVAGMEPAERADASKLLKGLTVHLRNEEQKDMIVRGDYPLSGADNVWFWIVTSVDNHPSAFWVGANAVTILNSRHNGYADIQTDWFAASNRRTQIFHYGGHHYKFFRDRYKDLSLK